MDLFSKHRKKNITFNSIIDSINNKQISANNLRNIIHIKNNNPNKNSIYNNILMSFRTESKK